MATQTFINRLFSGSGIRAMFRRFVAGRTRILSGAALQSALGFAFPSLTLGQRVSVAGRFTRIRRAGRLLDASAFPSTVNISEIPLVPPFSGGVGVPRRFVYQVHVSASAQLPDGTTRQIDRMFLVQSDMVIDELQIGELARQRILDLSRTTGRYVGFSVDRDVSVDSVDVQWSIRRT